MRKLSKWIVVFLFTVASVPLLAQHSTATDCLGALAKDYYSYTESSNLSLDWLRSIDQETYESAKKDNSFSALGIFSGGMFSLSDDYSQFDQKRSKYLETVHYTRNESDAKQIVAMTTSDRAFQAYESCLRSIGQNGGVLVWATRTTMNEIDLIVKYANPPSRPSARLYGAVTGGSVAGAPRGQLWRNGLRWGTMQEKAFTVIPDAGESATTVQIQDEFGGPVVAVTFARADGLINLQYVGTTPIERNANYSIDGPISPNNDNNTGGCPNEVGRDGGGYCKSGTLVSFAVSAPRYLQNARGSIHGGGAGWAETWRQPTISQDGLSASYGSANWGSPVYPTLTVDIWEHMSALQCGSPTPIPALMGQGIVIAVQNDCMPIASVQWKTYKKNNSGVVSVGQSSPGSDEGVVQAGAVASGDYTLITYKLRPSQTVGAVTQHVRFQ